MAAGDWDAAFGPVVNAFDEVMADDRGGAAIAVYRHGRPVVDAWHRAARRSSVGRDPPAVSFSTTKAVTGEPFEHG